MRKFILLFVLPLLVFGLSSCKDDDEKVDNMIWEVVSNSDKEAIKVINKSSTDLEIPSVVEISAIYSEGDVVLKCKNHTIAFSLIGPNDSYYNKSMGLKISRVDDRSLKVHFDNNPKGTEKEDDMITVTNGDGGKAFCTSYIKISRTFGELISK